MLSTNTECKKLAQGRVFALALALGREDGPAGLCGFTRFCGRGNISRSTIIWFKSWSWTEPGSSGMVRMNRTQFEMFLRLLCLCGICPAPSPLWLGGGVKSDSAEHSVLPKAEHFSTLGDQKITSNVRHSAQNSLLHSVNIRHSHCKQFKKYVGSWKNHFGGHMPQICRNFIFQSGSNWYFTRTMYHDNVKTVEGSEWWTLQLKSSSLWCWICNLSVQ